MTSNLFKGEVCHSVSKLIVRNVWLVWKDRKPR